MQYEQTDAGVVNLRRISLRSVMSTGAFQVFCEHERALARYAVYEYDLCLCIYLADVELEHFTLSLRNDVCL